MSAANPHLDCESEQNRQQTAAQAAPPTHRRASRDSKHALCPLSCPACVRHGGAYHERPARERTTQSSFGCHRRDQRGEDHAWRASFKPGSADGGVGRKRHYDNPSSPQHLHCGRSRGPQRGAIVQGAGGALGAKGRGGSAALPRTERRHADAAASRGNAMGDRACVQRSGAERLLLPVGGDASALHHRLWLPAHTP